MAARKRIVAGNWKMNTDLDTAVALVKEVAAKAGDPGDVTVVFFPPFPYLRMVREVLIEDMSFFAGAQNCSEHEKGAYTGEVSAAMLRNVGCRFVLVGHSERRQYFNESDAQLAGKVRQVLANHMAVIYCIGETLAQRKSAAHFSVVQQQLEAIHGAVPADKLERFVIAYEPVWAIGTGETATPAQAQEMHAHIRSVVKDLWGDSAAAGMTLLYGGSCNASNARELFACADVDGGLIGGASLKAQDFCAIINSF